MTNTSQLINKAKEDPTVLEQLLYPGKQISDYNTDDLKVEVLPTGFASLDKYMVLKRNRGELVFIGARPSMGKSALLFQMAMNVARYGKAHTFSLEDSHEAIVTRQTAILSNISMDVIQLGMAPKHVLEGAKRSMAEFNCVLDTEGGLNVYQICERARMQHKKSALHALFIDYIQIIRSDRKISRAEDVAVISSELKALAKELRIPVVVSSQLNRNADQRESKKPQLSDLKESGSLEQDADVVLLIHREGRDAEVIIAKNKNGPTGSILMEYNGAQTKFIDLGIKGELD